MAESGVHACASAVWKAGKQSIQHAGVPVTREQIEDYVAHRQGEDRTSESIQKYARDLDALYRFLPEEKRIYPETLSQWRGSLLGEGYAPRTVNSMVSVANSFLKWLGHRELQLTGQLNIAYDQPELTRNEYLRLLSAARHLNKERTYLLVKVFTTVNITVLELPRLTVEAVRGDQVEFTANGVRYLAAIPSCLRDELLDYARRSCITSGPIFVTRTGKPLGRTAVTAYIQSLAQTARVAPEKCNPRCLHKLYQSTMDGIEAAVRVLAEQSHERLLEQEQLLVGWQEEPVKSRRGGRPAGKQFSTTK